MKRRGFLYGFVNKHRAYKNVVKIGVSRQTLKSRSRELNTGVLGDFKPFIFIYSRSYEMMERLTRDFFKYFTKYKIEGKELYRLDRKKTIRLFKIFANVFEARYHVVPPSADYLFCSWDGGEAVCENRGNGHFVVPRGTMVKKCNEKALSDSYRKLHRKLVRKGYIKGGVFKKQFDFDSKSAAAAMILGCQSNGRKIWRPL